MTAQIANNQTERAEVKHKSYKSGPALRLPV